jgi:Fur family ferric uptake transcriptional regulator
MSCHKLLESAMRDQGLRMTRQRRLVLDAVHTIHHPATAEEILQSVNVSDSRADITTVYRTLNFLEGFGLISAYDAGNGRRRFEHNGGDGSPHLICRECGRTSEIAQAGFKIAVTDAVRKSGYDVQLSSVVIPGLCPVCKRKRTKNERPRGKPRGIQERNPQELRRKLRGISIPQERDKS